MLSRSGSIDASSELLSELRALLTSGGVLGEMDERRIRNVALHINDTYRQMQSIDSNPYLNKNDSFSGSAIQYYRAKYLRQKRCLLAYLLWRLNRIADSWWKSQDNRITGVLHSSEETYLQEYDNTMVEYMTALPIPLDLRAFSWRPPSVQQLEVRGLTNHFFVSPISGETVNIYVGKQILLNFEDAEPLIKQGFVELIN